MPRSRRTRSRRGPWLAGRPVRRHAQVGEPPPQFVRRQEPAIRADVACCRVRALSPAGRAAAGPGLRGGLGPGHGGAAAPPSRSRQDDHRQQRLARHACQARCWHGGRWSDQHPARDLPDLYLLVRDQYQHQYRTARLPIVEAGAVTTPGFSCS
jgi:hypothetical protein